MKLLVNVLNKEYLMNYNTKKNYSTDSGFDLYCVEDVTILPWQVGTINSGIACSPVFSNKDDISGYYLYPRSSISKTPLMLANSIGIIDANYTGTILSKVRNMSDKPYNVTKGTSLFQLCTPNLKPFSEVIFVDKLEDTDRGNNGFGSTN